MSGVATPAFAPTIQAVASCPASHFFGALRGHLPPLRALHSLMAPAPAPAPHWGEPALTHREPGRSCRGLGATDRAGWEMKYPQRGPCCPHHSPFRNPGSARSHRHRRTSHPLAAQRVPAPPGESRSHGFVLEFTGRTDRRELYLCACVRACVCMRVHVCECMHVHVHVSVCACAYV